MNYSLSGGRGFYCHAVAIPRVILEQHLKFASARQLKAILYMFASTEEVLSSEELAAFLGCAEEELEDVMEYWFASGIVSREGKSCPASPRTEEAPSTVHLKLEVPKAPDKAPQVTKIMDAPRLSPQDIIHRGNEDPRIAGLLTEAQSVLCRTISHSEQEMLVNMVDYYGLKPEVILMILAYAKGAGKANTRYISAMAKNWSDEGVDSVEQAEQKLEAIARCDERWRTVCALAELPVKSPTPKQMEFTECWMEKWGFTAEMVGRAFEIAKDNEIKKAFPYVNKILQRWHENGIKTPIDIARNEQKNSKAAGGKNRITSDASYDIQQIEADSFEETLKFGG